MSERPGRRGPGVLILGGTGEAAALARALDIRCGANVRVVSSLAGRTRVPAGLPGEVRTGGFGGADGLAAYLRNEGFAAVIDATHPFADQISRHAHAAARVASVPHLRIERPAWVRVDGDDWRMAATVEDAADIATRLARRIFLTVGHGDLDAFAGSSDCWFLVRVVDPPADSLALGDYEVISARGPFDVDGERALMERHEIDALVCKASGGDMTYPKLVAARQLGVPVVMVERPPAPPGDAVEDVDSAVDWLLDLWVGNSGAEEVERSR